MSKSERLVGHHNTLARRQYYRQHECNSCRKHTDGVHTGCQRQQTDSPRDVDRRRLSSSAYIFSKTCDFYNLADTDICQECNQSVSRINDSLRGFCIYVQFVSVNTFYHQYFRHILEYIRIWLNDSNCVKWPPGSLCRHSSDVSAFL